MTDPRVADLFARAVELPEAERAAFVTAECTAAPELAAQVLTLLRHDAPLTPAGLQSPLAAAPARIDQFVVTRSLGAGGMGEVFQAEQLAPVQRTVAIKLMRVGADAAGLLARFAMERQVLAWLDHPHIAKIFAAGTAADGRPYFVMELVDGVSLTEFCTSERLDLAARLRLFVLVCRGVQHAHQRGVIHRDLKPSNVLVRRVDGEPQPKIIDFGVAKLMGDDAPGSPATVAGQVVGTPEYMSPEQLATGAPADVRGDVYSLGVMLYEVLAGARPLPAVPGESVAQLLRRLTEHEPASPSSALARTGRAAGALRIPRELDWITGKALAREPARRYQTVQQLIDDLEAHTRGLPVSAGAPTVVYRAAKLVRRHKALVSATLAVLVALLAGLTAALWQASVAARHAERVEQDLVQIRRLADDRLAEALLDLARSQLWPIVPEMGPDLQRWLSRCDELAARLPLHEADLAAAASELGAGAITAESFVRAELADTRHDELRWRHGTLDRLVRGTRRLLDDAARYGRRDVRERVAKLAELEAVLAAAAPAWDATLRDLAAAPRYAGVQLARQVDLVPLGCNRETGLFEFWHVVSGARPEFTDERGVTRLRAEDGIVLVLLPGGRFAMGAEPRADAINSDALAHDYEAPVHDVELAPFMLSKFELTQAQVLRWTGKNPSWFAAERSRGVRERANVTPLNPVEQVAFDEAVVLMRQMGLELPTEAQWEYACRAGSHTRFFWGDDERRFGEFANIADEASATFFKPGTEFARGVDDGQGVHAPVGSYAPNQFGLYDMLGNIGEWCRDWSGRYAHSTAPGTGERLAESDGRRTRIIRGGTFVLAPRDCRCAARGDGVLRELKWSVGVRPGRAIAK